MSLIGQTGLHVKLKYMTNLPNLILLVGESGAGKKTLCRKVAQERNEHFILIGNKIADVRKLIEDTVSLNEKYIYYINEADNLTIQAENALLKICEEPPRNLTIIIGVKDVSNILETIRSRGMVFHMEHYKREDIKELLQAQDKQPQYTQQLLDCATTPGKLLNFINNDFDNIYLYAKKVLDNILVVSTGNSFKIGDKLAFKESDTGIPIDLFMDVFINAIPLPLDRDIYSNILLYCIEANMYMNRKGANKKLIFDIMILNIRTLR